MGSTCGDEAWSGAHAAGTYSRQMIWRQRSLELAIGGEEFGGQPGPDKSWPNLWSLGRCTWPLMLSHFPVLESLGSRTRKPSQTASQMRSCWDGSQSLLPPLPENGAATPPDPHFPVTIVTSRYGSERFFNAIIVTNHTINYTY